MNKEAADSAISYGVGGSLVTFATVGEITTWLHLIALIIGILIGCVRLAHDSLVFYRKLKNK